jgi:serine/threonine protein kinase
MPALGTQQVAVKELHPDIKLRSSDLRKLRREIDLHSKLTYPCIVQFVGACTVLPNVCMVMEMAPLGSLHNLLHGQASFDAHL